MSIIVLSGRLVCSNSDEAVIVHRYLPRHVGLTRAEAGCLRFDVEPTDDPLVWSVSERFVDQESFDAHQARVRGSRWGGATSGIVREYVIETRAEGS